MGPEGFEPSTNQVESIVGTLPFGTFPTTSSPNRACTFQRKRLSSNYFRKGKASSSPDYRFRYLCPFPVYRALPRSFEYYGHSVTLHLSMFRRSPSSLTHHVCT